MSEAGFEPARPLRGTSTSSWRVCRFATRTSARFQVDRRPGRRCGAEPFPATGQIVRSPRRSSASRCPAQPGAPERLRTAGLPRTKRALSPTELQGQGQHPDGCAPRVRAAPAALGKAFRADQSPAAPDKRDRLRVSFRVPRLGYQVSNLEPRGPGPRALPLIELYPIDLGGHLCRHTPAW